METMKIKEAVEYIKREWMFPVVITLLIGAIIITWVFKS